MVSQIEDQNLSYMQRIRRHLHQYPELSMNEVKTTSFIREELKKLDVPFLEVADNATVAILGEGREGKNLLIRADIDALPIEEETCYNYASKNIGIMHACGHDLHTASLLGFIQKFKEENIKVIGHIYCVFQPAEEVGKGANIIIEYLKEKQIRIDEAIAVHTGTEVPFGKVNVEAGSLMSGIKSFKTTIKGVGGHASRPDEVNDVIQAMVTYISTATRLKEREINPNRACVLSFSTVHGGNKSNILPSEIEIGGGIRYFKSSDLLKIEDILYRSAKSVELAFNVETDTDYSKGVLPLFNDDTVTENCRKSVLEVFGPDSIIEEDPIMATDDFTNFLNEYTGCYILIGARKEGEKAYPVHNSRFNPDEKIMDYIRDYYIHYVKNFL